jgi:hypothetical protein
MMGAALVTMADSAKAYLRRRTAAPALSRTSPTQQQLTTASP